ncbi:major facilitator superfamily protein [Mycolicibacterium mageritense DSM 44476 = CIP 104973]|uniref:Putative proline/betaine transporter n=2 Tax=Mycolicibacterium mageritense TaxID=53462 RepID=A0AAI8TPM7_MYCME|nr:MFS transporter [Mycolicibacterium mageritense]BBX31070.1 MFS transporter [Mycolicibacterium mageritense]BDY26222.1 Fosfomycin resistance protein AbaF [Mycolicibacterium mageritense]GJJ16896.1 MFS transporter [Mycolicibacterium mageritense]CDO24819.1 major facilitator superfamily protein [Mycolicibacterium mageritense DSM 44476 = CIP 104973]
MTIAADPVASAAPHDAKAVRTAVLASVVGTTIEWYDFFLYATAASLVFNHAFFPDQSSYVGTMLAFATFAVGFVVRPIGGFVFGHVGDRIGRKRTLALTMLLMGGATALMGLLPTAAQIGVLAPILLLVLRVVQGFALGGEWGGAVLLAVEHSPRHRRGLFGSIPQVGLALGLALGTGVFVVLQLALSAEAFQSYGWRIAFLISIVLVIFGVVVRFRVAETPAFEQIRRDDDRASVPLREIFTPPTLRSTVLGLLSRWGEGAAFNTWGVFTISYATATLHLGKVPVLVVVTAAAVLMAVLLPVSGLLADRFSPRTVYASGIAAYGLVVFPAFLLFGTRSIAAYAVGMLLAFGVIHAWFYGAQGTLYASLFPTRTRYTGLSTVYQLSGVYASGLTPLILTALIATGDGRPWYACAYLVGTAAISVVATLLLKPQH